MNMLVPIEHSFVHNIVIDEDLASDFKFVKVALLALENLINV